METPICHECGQPMSRETKPMELKYKSQAVTIKMPGWYCVCGESIHTGKDMIISDRAINVMKARGNGFMVPEKIRQVRKSLKLSQRKAGEIIGGGPNAFYKYENGDVVVSQAMNNLLKVLEQNPQVIHMLSTHATF